MMVHRIPIITESTPGLLQRITDGVVEKQHDDRKDIQAGGWYQKPADQSPDLTVQNIIRIQIEICSQVSSCKFQYIADDIGYDNIQGQISDSISAELTLQLV